MIGMVLVTHGHLATEFRAALEHVVGPQRDIETITIGPEDDMEQRRQDIVAAVASVDSGQGVVLLTDMFGPEATSLRDLDPFKSELPVLDTHLSAQVRNILQYLEQGRGSKGMAVQLARQGLDGAEYEFARMLVEDRNNEAQSYVDWLVHVHRLIQLEVS